MSSRWQKAELAEARSTTRAGQELIELAEDLRDQTDQFASGMQSYLTFLERDGSSPEGW